MISFLFEWIVYFQIDLFISILLIKFELNQKKVEYSSIVGILSIKNKFVSNILGFILIESEMFVWFIYEMNSTISSLRINVQI